MRRALDGFPTSMLRFVTEVYGPEAVDEAWAEFMLWEGGDFDPESPLCAIFLPWMFHYWEPASLEETSVQDSSLHGRSPTSVYLERRGPRLDPLLRRYLEACLESPFSFHEIRRVDTGRGFRTRDLITGEEHEVLERSASATMEAGDILFGQLVPVEGIALLEASSPYALRPADKLPILELRERIASGPRRNLSARDLTHEWRIELRELYLRLIDAILNPTPPVIHNTDGELVLPQRLIFEIDDAEAAYAALKHLSVGEVDEDLSSHAERGADGKLAKVELDWRKAGNRMHASWDSTILGHLEITKSRLVAHVNSNERAESFRKIVADALGDGARYRGSELPEPATPAAADDEHARLAELPEVREHLNRMLAAHYEGWPTQEIPALGDRRPIDAVKDAEGRERVEALLVQMERDSRRMSPPPDEAIFQRLRERLGLDGGPGGP